MSVVKFAEVQRWATKSGPCAVCGAPAKRSRTFWQTLNPWNVNAAGQPKTHEEIGKELNERVIEWKVEPLVHARCE